MKKKLEYAQHVFGFQQTLYMHKHSIVYEKNIQTDSNGKL